MKKIIVTIAATAALGLTLGACGGGGKQAEVIDHADPPSSTTTTPTTSPPNVGAVGDKIRTANDNEMTVYAYEQPTQVQYVDPAPGKEFAAADTEACFTGIITDARGRELPAAEQVMDANPFQYALIMPDNTRLQPSFGKDPALNGAELTKGQCVRGWVTFQVPVGSRPVSIVDTQTGPPAIQWRIG